METGIAKVLQPQVIPPTHKPMSSWVAVSTHLAISFCLLLNSLCQIVLGTIYWGCAMWMMVAFIYQRPFPFSMMEEVRKHGILGFRLPSVYISCFFLGKMKSLTGCYSSNKATDRSSPMLPF